MDQTTHVSSSCVIKNNILGGMNAIWLGDSSHCIITGNHHERIGTGYQCFAFLDSRNEDTAGLGSEDHGCIVQDNTMYIERYDAAATVEINPYMVRLHGWGHVIANNSFIAVDSSAAAQASAAIYFVRLSGGATLPSGHYELRPTVIANNTFITAHYDSGALATTKGYTALSMGNATATTGLHGDVQLTNNRFINLGTVTTKLAIDAQQDSATAATITVYEGGLGNYESETITLSNVNLVWKAQSIHAEVSIANVTDEGPSDAQLDAAFGQPATLGEGWLGFVNDADGGVNNFICWVSDAKWVYLKGTVAS